MCIVSMVTDDWSKRYPQLIDAGTWQGAGVFESPVRRYELDGLKKEIEELKKLLMAAKAYDEATGQKDCEKEENVKVLIALGKKLGVDLEGVLK